MTCASGAGCQDAHVDDVRGHRSLDQPLAGLTGLLATDMALDPAYARRIAELLTAVFTEAFQLTATGIRHRVRFTPDLAAGQFHWQGRTLGLAPGGSRRFGFQLLELRLDHRDAGINLVVQQAALQTVELLTALAVRVTLEQGQLMAQLLVAQLASVAPDPAAQPAPSALSPVGAADRQRTL